MKILYIGDVMAESGIKVVSQVLPDLKRDESVDFVIAQAENVSEGKSMVKSDMQRLQSMGVDFFTGGNWSLFNEEILSGDYPVIRPANYPPDTPGAGYKYIDIATGSVLVISLLGKIVGRDADKPMDNPLKTVDEILKSSKNRKPAAVVVNFHGDYSSEKRVIGYYLDGRVSAVIGDHWHVPSADAMVLPKGTAHITDVGMCGALHSSLGIKLETVISRWRDKTVNKNELETKGPLQFNAVLIETDDQTGLAKSIKQIQQMLE